MSPSPLERFQRKQPVPASPLLTEYLASPGAREHAPVEYLTHARIYEFDWGFVAETEEEDFPETPGGRTGPAYFWEVYVREVWRTGTNLWFDRFLTAYKCLAEPVIERTIAETRLTARPIFITFDDGISNWSALSFASLADATEDARAFFAKTLLGDILPHLIQRALDPTHTFDQKWSCA